MERSMAMISFKQYIEFLVENRLDFLKKRYHDLSSQHEYPAGYVRRHDFTGELDHLFDDPIDIITWFDDNDETNTNGKYLDWVLNLYKKKLIRQEDAPYIWELLGEFEQYKSKIPNKDINFYKNRRELRDAINHAKGLSVQDIGTPIDHKGAKKIFSEKGVTVYKILDLQAARFYAEGTEWCTKAKEMFDKYNNQGPLYVVFCKDSTGKPSRFQFHFPSNQFMDPSDIGVNLFMLVQWNWPLMEVPEFQGEQVNLTKDINKHFDELFHKKNTHCSLIASNRLNDKNFRKMIDRSEELSSAAYYQLLFSSSFSKNDLDYVIKHPNLRRLKMAIFETTKARELTKIQLNYIIKHESGELAVLASKELNGRKK